MQKIFLTLGIACFALAGGMSADLISSSISVDGSSWIKSSLTGGKIYFGLLFTNDQSTVTRPINFSKDLDTQTRISSTGPVGIQEYSTQSSTLESEIWRCMFARSDDVTLVPRSRPGESLHQGIIQQSGVCQRI